MSILDFVSADYCSENMCFTFSVIFLLIWCLLYVAAFVSFFWGSFVFNRYMFVFEVFLLLATFLVNSFDFVFFSYLWCDICFECLVCFDKSFRSTCPGIHVSFDPSLWGGFEIFCFHGIFVFLFSPLLSISRWGCLAILILCESLVYCWEVF